MSKSKTLRLSRFGQKFTAGAGIISLMDDLGNALAHGGDMIMMGGGNPGFIPPVEAAFRNRLQHMAESAESVRMATGVYDPPQGEVHFIRALVSYLNHRFGWSLTPENIALTNGSQSAFFMLFNMLAGEQADGSFKRVLFPLAPEYIGYADSGLSEGMFVAQKPTIERMGDHFFKYHVDFDALEIGDDIAALCVSRPTNPTGNVLTNEEMDKLDRLARQHDIPLIVDGAYGTPFPNLIFSSAAPRWNDNTILCLSLSKLGLPAVRTGIVVANPEVIRAVSSINAIMNLATGSFGAVLASELLASGELDRLCQEQIRPFYEQKANRAVQILIEELAGLPFRIHKPEGAMFLWLWFEGLPVSSRVLYQRLKRRGVLVVAGEYFFPGLEDDDWPHRYECLRVTYSQDDDQVEKGLRIIADEVRLLMG